MKFEEKCEKIINEVSDDKNPEYLFSDVDSKLLIDIASGKIDAKKLAAQEMSNRGFDKKGKWVGYDKAEKIWGNKLNF